MAHYFTCSSKQLLEILLENPDDEQSRDELSLRIQDSACDEELSSAFEELFGKQDSPSTESSLVDSSKPTWSNCIEEQTCYPSRILEPKSLSDLVCAVNNAKSQQGAVRAVGSGHSFSNVASLNNDVLLNPQGMKKVLKIDSTSLKDPAKVSDLFRVESGITVEDLNTALDNNKPCSLALKNMGAYNGQTLAGAISTGTHGTGIIFGPIASSVVSLVLVSESGVVYQIEPTDGITDPAKFAPDPADVVLKQDDDWFQSTLVAMGCMGLIYSYTLEVIPAYLLCEVRTVDTWENLRPQLTDNTTSHLIACNRHYEIDLNPYVVNNGKYKGKHLAITTVRNKNCGPPGGKRGLKNWLAGLLASYPNAEKFLVNVYNKHPHFGIVLTNKALKTLETLKPPYIAKSFQMMDLGKVNHVKAYALELSIDATANLVDQIDKLIQILEQAALNQKFYMSGPVALRFVASASPFLAPQQGRPTCMVELDMLYGTVNGYKLLTLVKNQMCTQGSGVRVHWGLDLDTVTEQEVPGMFEQWGRWLKVYQELNAGGMWNSPFTDRLGITITTPKSS